MWAGFVGVVLYRSAEALLNYMEASYEKNGTLDGTAREYWQILRRRAHVSEDIDATIMATDMAKEAENDWGAYSAGRLLTDKTLYNIRRERRSEFLSEGLRYMDVCRWRAMDQMLSTPYIPEGMHLWNTPMEQWYNGWWQTVLQMQLYHKSRIVSIFVLIVEPVLKSAMEVISGKWLIIWSR